MSIAKRKSEGTALPHGYEEGKRYPLIVEVHGGPSWQWEDRLMLSWHDPPQFLAGHGFAVLALNPRGSTGRGSDFWEVLSAMSAVEKCAISSTAHKRW
ncbi:MAG: hypothetical protein R2843_10980 [Thermomicrobiales bacterium]